VNFLHHVRRQAHRIVKAPRSPWRRVYTYREERNIRGGRSLRPEARPRLSFWAARRAWCSMWHTLGSRTGRFMASATWATTTAPQRRRSFGGLLGESLGFETNSRFEHIDADRYLRMIQDARR